MAVDDGSADISHILRTECHPANKICTEASAQIEPQTQLLKMIKAYTIGSQPSLV
jgi:hypothetical protein